MCKVLILLVMLSLGCLEVAAGRFQGISLVVHAREASQSDCAQPEAERELLIREAQVGAFTLRRLELVGNVSTPDELIHSKISYRLSEGNVFKRSDLFAALKNVSKVKSIYPITMKDIVARLNREEKDLDLRICIRERDKLKKTAN